MVYWQRINKTATKFLVQKTETEDIRICLKGKFTQVAFQLQPVVLVQCISFLGLLATVAKHLYKTSVKLNVSSPKQKHAHSFLLGWKKIRKVERRMKNNRCQQFVFRKGVYVFILINWLECNWFV